MQYRMPTTGTAIASPNSTRKTPPDLRKRTKYTLDRSMGEKKFGGLRGHIGPPS